MVRIVSRVKNSQSRHWDELTTREETTSTWCADQNNTLLDLAGKESDVTKAKLKTSRVVTK